MGEDQGQVGTPVENDQKSPEQLRREIEDAREDLGETAAALATKVDVKSRAKEKVEGVKQTVAEKKNAFASKQGAGADGTAGPAAQASSAAMQARTKAQENPVATAALGAFVSGFIFGRITSR